MAHGLYGRHDGGYAVGAPRVWGAGRLEPPPGIGRGHAVLHQGGEMAAGRFLVTVEVEDDGGSGFSVEGCRGRGREQKVYYIICLTALTGGELCRIERYGVEDICQCL